MHYSQKAVIAFDINISSFGFINQTFEVWLSERRSLGTSSALPRQFSIALQMHLWNCQRQKIIQSILLLDWLRRNGIWFFWAVAAAEQRKLTFMSWAGIIWRKTRWVLEYWLSLFIIFFRAIANLCSMLCSLTRKAWMKDEIWHSKCKFGTVVEN